MYFYDNLVSQVSIEDYPTPQSLCRLHSAPRRALHTSGWSPGQSASLFYLQTEVWHTLGSELPWTGLRGSWVPGGCFRRGCMGSEYIVALGPELSVPWGGVQLEEGQIGPLKRRR